MRNRWAMIGAVTLLSVASAGFFLDRSIDADEPVFEEGLFENVRSHVSRFYVDSLPDSELYRRAAEGLLTELKDPYSELLTGDDYKALTEQTTGNYAGLGIQIDVRDSWITIVAPLPETPAEEAGLEPGDQIIEVDGQSTEGWSSEKAVSTLRGEPGSRVRITVRRAGVGTPIPFELTRARIHHRSVPAGTLFDGGIGLISVTTIAETSADELHEEIERLRGEGMRELILDLRTNPGGLLDQGVQVADLFLDAGDEIVSTRGRAPGTSRTFVDKGRQRWAGLPIVVLVNQYTASAAEIIAGALQDHDRAVVIGVPTFGKGLVQTLYPLADGVALKLTTARWYTPVGRSIQRDTEDDAAFADRATPADTMPTEGDSAILSRPEFRTDGGRIVRGGGGIVPDMVVRPDTLLEGEQQFVAALGDRVAAYRDVLTTYALELKGQGTLASPSFDVTPAMLEVVQRRLAGKGVTMTDEQFDGGARLVRQHLAYEASRYVFGRQAEFRRRAEDDPQMQRALEILRGTDSPSELLQQAMAASRLSSR